MKQKKKDTLLAKAVIHKRRFMLNNNKCVWDALKESEKPVILYGMGNGADKVLDEFEKRNIKCCGVMASDDFVRYQNFRGFTVKKMSDFEEEFGDFTIALCFASSLSDVMSHIKYVASRHTLLVPNVPVFGDEILDDAFLEKYKDEIKSAYSHLCDEKSKKVFKSTLDFLYSGKLSYLLNADSQKDEAFTNILKLNDAESYLDLGAYRGDTVEEFLHYTNDYEKIVAIEPNVKNFKKLCAYCENIKNTTLINAGISDKNGTALVSKGGGRQSVLSDTNGIEIDTITLDSITENHGDFSYIKIDIEGMEHKMLECASLTLSKKPKLNCAAYHTNSDFFTLINKIHKLNPDYKIYIRKHPYIPCWDLNLYCK